MVHGYNNKVEKWGNKDGKDSDAHACSTDGEFLAEYSIFEPFLLGEEHWEGGPVTSPDLDAMQLNEPGIGTEGIMKGVGNVLRNGANFTERLPDTVFDPSLDYSYTPDAADAAMEAAVMNWAGNVQLSTFRSRAALLGRRPAPSLEGRV